MKKISLTTLQLIIFLSSLIVLGISYYLQYGKGFEPCPLCLMQRLCIIFILIVGAINLYNRPIYSKKLIITQGFLILIGLYFASRQMWLLSLPSNEIPACLPGLNVLIHYFPWQDTFRALLWGSGDCTEIRWTLFGLSLPSWSALYFLAIGITCSLLYFNRHKDFRHINE